jgi:6-phosphogluconolactonase
MTLAVNPLIRKIRTRAPFSPPIITLRSAIINSLLILLPLSVNAAQERFYIGTYTGPGQGQGIYTGILDSDTGRLGQVQLAVKANNPGYLALAPDAAHLYAVSSDGGGSVAAFTIGKNGALSALNHVSSCGAGPCHLSVDPSGGNVLVANYAGGNIASIPIAAGGVLAGPVETAAFHGSGPDPDRQKKPFAHFISTDGAGQFVYACDLGTDHVWIYRYSPAGHFWPPMNMAKVPPGSGPRHLAFGPGQDFAYVNGEMGRNVTVFHRDKTTGSLTPIQTLPIVPDAKPAHGITTAEIKCHPSGKWLYVSSRGDDILAVFAIRPDGKLTFIQDIPSVVKFPRGFGIDPSGRWLIAAGQNDGKLALFAIDQSTGKLTPTGQEANAPGGICVLFAPAS